jgi:UDP-glucose 4-epimerase
MNIFLTGGAGYIGSAAAQTLLEAGHSVTIYDSLVKGYRAAVPEGARFITADLADQETLQAALSSESYDAVMHFAAFIEAGESMQFPGKYFYNNLVLSCGLIDAVARIGIPRFVLSSTASVYASSEEPLTEESAIEPNNVYGQTKLMIEQVLDWYRHIHNLHYATLRYFNAAGALAERGEAHRPETHLIPLVLQVALEQREDIKVFGTDYPTPDGTCIRDYIHIADLVQAHVLALDALESNEKLIYNLGTGAGYSVREVIDVARKVTEHDIPATEAPRRPGDAPRLVANSSKIQSELGWQPQYPELETILLSAWNWHRNHPQGYQS